MANRNRACKVVYLLLRVQCTSVLEQVRSAIVYLAAAGTASSVTGRYGCSCEHVSHLELVEVRRDGHGYVEVRRDSHCHSYTDVLQDPSL